MLLNLGKFSLNIQRASQKLAGSYWQLTCNVLGIPALHSILSGKHCESIQLVVIPSPHSPVVLGQDWFLLKLHNLQHKLP